jgi:nanoRNase/pAp phosphatase (c-di-AMP/oligoRNAs hydrolase)
MLVTAPNHVDDVAQEAFDVIGQQNGIVNRSTITQTGGADGNAFIQLSVPSSSLAQVMSKLSLLPNADVVSRTDNSQDVNNTFTTATRRLADARALHTSLLKQLAAAVTTEQVDSLHEQIRDNERAIAADEAGLARLNHRISFSAISLTINARTQPSGGGGHSGGGGFTLPKAAHDAGRVLVVVAGVALIALAVLIPVGLVVAFAWWIGALATHRRRERALDLA